MDRRNFLTASGGGVAAMLAPALARDMTGALDTAYINGRIWTGAGPGLFTDALGIKGDRIGAIGHAAVRSAAARSTRIVDLKGAFVTPGFIDAHVHFVKASVMLTQPSLRTADSPEDFVRRIGEAARKLPKGEWLQGGNWDQDRWGGRMPHRSWIDPVTADTPVAVIRYDLHMMLLNSVALKLAGIDRNTPDMPGGVIERDAKGEPTGIIKDAAKQLAIRAIGAPSDARIDAAVRQGIALALSKGVTGVHSTEIDWVSQAAFQRLNAAGSPGIRFRSYVPLADWARQAKLIADHGSGDDGMRLAGCKVVFDGSLGSRTALFYDPYIDDPSTHGITVTDPADLERWMMAADKAGLQIAVHAIGDKANDTVLDIMASVAAANGERDRRFRIEHAQHLTPAAIPRFARQGVIASIQPYHAVDDGRWAARRIEPDRLKTSFAFHSLIASGAHVCMGSDWPVAPIDPLSGLKAAVLRETIDGENPGGWYPEQRIGLAQALSGYTRGGAYAAFAERRLGVLAPGFLADFTVFDTDLFAIDPERMTDAKVLRTVVSGLPRFVA
ncbi:amidohydrolase [Sphingomonas sp. 2378]|uniref:amidohydrolase n=1 Tax=Sphingomonas sp. 2378 TaxID=1219748 RepID=UPI00311AF5EC